MKDIDLSFFLDPPIRSATLDIEVTAMAPLSMVSQQPGSYFRSELLPTTNMLFGMIENILGWHFETGQRKDILKGLVKAAKKKHRKVEEWKGHPWLTGRPQASDSGFVSLLQYHLDVELLYGDERPLAYDDLWSMQLIDQGRSFFGGSRNYDYRIDPHIEASRNKRMEFGEGKNFEKISPAEALEVLEGKMHYQSVRHWFPLYYSSPKTRGYVVHDHPIGYRLYGTPVLLKLISSAILEPAVCPYLGHSEGWVEVKTTDHD